ncbi:GIY-YIG nuclease family protein [Shewanella sp. 202IG2-18]|uniref:GIY-YIG nuclease family protein n=1 Tax=Parashewanella hymeniacidonis TaxID=2807618 RepID=UPI00195F757C|nr:GIY-YIG nuclease family protein [Parashewanella hymeniacidonis]MBM7071722.1 GIY-YIG nuclease family protein [Parashewanella hymeniacidonis]
MDNNEFETKPWWVYIIQTHKGLLYTGCTTDIERRFREHQSGGTKAAKFLKGKGPLELRYREQVNDKSTALKREIEIKKMPRSKKLTLISMGSKTEK